VDLDGGGGGAAAQADLEQFQRAGASGLGVPFSTAARRAASWAAPSTTCWACHHSPNCNAASTISMNSQATRTNSMVVTPRSSV
jgi:hypothetical protein